MLRSLEEKGEEKERIEERLTSPTSWFDAVVPYQVKLRWRRGGDETGQPARTGKDRVRLQCDEARYRRGSIE
jgi:hypothetical protein